MFKWCLALVLIACACGYISCDNVPTEDEIRSEWLKFKENYGILTDEKYDRFKVNYLKSLEHNREANETYSTSVHPYSLLDEDEARSLLRFGLKPDRPDRPNNTRSIDVGPRVVIPSSVDWTSTFGPAKQQSSCGSCWAFSTAGVLESLYYRRTRARKDFSVQQLVDCTLNNRRYQNYGCQGGWPDVSFEYIKQVGLTDAYSYAYTAREGYCRESSFANRVRITSHYEVPYGSEQELMKAVALYGPVAIAIDASRWGFTNYRGGIYNDPGCSRSNLNHAVILAGYGTENGQDYWLVRNSWGTRWGINGYIKMARNRGNQCGIASMASYAIY